MNDDLASRKFTSDQISKIIRQALTMKNINATDYKGLLEIGQELGIDPAKIEEAIRREEAEEDDRTLREKWLKDKRSEFHEHFWAYVIVNTALIFINIFAGGSWWFHWPILGWGIGLALHYYETHHPSENAIEKGIRKIRRKKQFSRKLKGIWSKFIED